MLWLQRLGLWVARWAGWSPTPEEALIETHARVVRLLEATQAELDVARRARYSAEKAFAAYAEKNLAIHADLRVRTEYLVSTLHRKGAHLSGEYKRHQVYADLLKEFPQVPKRDLSLAIEMAVRART